MNGSKNRGKGQKRGTPALPKCNDKMRKRACIPHRPYMEVASRTQYLEVRAGKPLSAMLEVMG